MTDLPQTMRALVVKGEGLSDTAEGPRIDDMTPYLELAEIPLPQPGPGEALIRMSLCPVNPSDLHFLKGEYGETRIKGRPAGFEGMGTVVAGDSPFIGQRVAVAGAGLGTWAEYCIAPSATLIPLRDDIAPTDGAALIVNPITAMALFQRVPEGEAFLVTAALSQVGRMLLSLAREGGKPAIAVVRRADQADAARAAGASEVIVTSAPDLAPLALKPRTLIDAVGDQSTADLFAAMPARARWISYGKLSAEAPRLDSLGHMIFMDKKIEGFWLTRWFRATPPEQILQTVMQVQARFADGRWSTGAGEIVPLGEAVERLPAALRAGGKTYISL